MSSPTKAGSPEAVPPFRRILAVDTTTPSGSVALLENGGVLGEIGVESPVTHSARLLASVDFLLRARGLGIGDVDGFAVTPGPGSFTGLRIGLSTVKSFAFASGKPVALVSSLLALAFKHRDGAEDLIAPMLDAKKGEIYAALFARSGARLKEAIPQGAYAPEEFVRLLPRRVALFAGSGVGLCRKRLGELLGDRARFSPRSNFLAAEVGLLGLETLRAGGGVPSGAVEPLYFRRSQAEEGR